ncbi:MAG TPA: CHRD domain-containing protein, partial [Balneolales bacterium]|nr:CHRD domain-containing protein [Balneolales bacterium]
MKRYRLSFGLLAIIAFMLGFAYQGYGQQVYTANMSGINEVPAGKSLGVGTVHVVVRGDSIKVYGSFSNLVGNYAASHIHTGAAGENGSVVFPLNPKVDTDQKGGTYDSLDNKFKLTADEMTALMDGNLYINIHSSDYASGELRGQLFPDGNKAPTASHITDPANGATVVIGGLGTDSLDFKWSKATDPENNPVFYVWQISLSSNFYSVPLEETVGTDSSVTLSKADIDELMQAASVPYGGDMTVYFRIFSTDGSMVTDGPTGSMAFKRDSVLYSIQQAHDAPSGTQVNIKGIVTRAYGDYAYMQDSTAGMTLHQSIGSFADAIANGSVKMGDSLRVSGNVSEYNSLVEINGADLQSYNVLSSNNMLPDPMNITLSDLENNGEMYEARLVRLTGLKVDGSGTFNPATSYKVTDATDQTGSIVLRTPSASDGTIAGASIPPDSTVFEGVVGQYSTSNPVAGYEL